MTVTIYGSKLLKQLQLSVPAQTLYPKTRVGNFQQSAFRTLLPINLFVYATFPIQFDMWLLSSDIWGYANARRVSDVKSALSLSNSIESEWCVNANTRYLHRTWSYRYNNSMFLWNWLSDYHKSWFLRAICVRLILKSV